MKLYGQEFLLDLYDCDPNTFTRDSISDFCAKVCEEIGMERGPIHFWDDESTPKDQKETEPHTHGISAVQFIRTSNITIHTLHMLRRVYLNVFSCNPFEAGKVEESAVNWFQGQVNNYVDIGRR